MPIKVLIVEDDLASQRLLNTHFRSAGFETVYAGDAIAAVAVAVKERPDAVVLDIGLPAGGGISVIERLGNLSQTAYTPIVVVSGRGPEEEAEALARGAVAFIRKPVEGPEVVEAARTAIGLLVGDPPAEG